MRIAVELDPPARNAPDAGKSLRLDAARLAAAGADIITIADNPRAEARADSAALAAFLYRETGVQAMPHLACRDRNELALKSALLALDIAGVRNVLVVTGDPPPPGSFPAKPAGPPLTSTGLAARIRGWNEDSFSAPFSLSAALNLNAANFDAELRKAKRKAEAGVIRFLTQPILSQRALENMARARASLGAELLGGILPIVSSGNAEFMASGKLDGVSIDPAIRALYSGTGKEEASRLAVELSLSFAGAMRPSVDGFYVIRPFRRTDIVEEIVRGLRSGDNEAARPVLRGIDKGVPLPHLISRREGVVIAERSTR